MIGHLVRCALLCAFIAVLFGDVIVHDVLGFPRRRRG